MDEWINEIKNCKKIKSNIVINKNISKEISINKQKQIEDLYNSNSYEISYKIEKNKTLGIDKNLDKKLKSGNFKIDYKIDFHGLTLEKAFDSLVYNINKAYKNNLKFLLVITGKGKGTEKNRDSIKSQIEKWMKHPDISSKVIKYVDAKNKDGGSGAIYILLKTLKLKR